MGLWDNIPELREEMLCFEEYAKGVYRPSEHLLKRIASEMVLSGGKRLRPALAILSAMYGEYDRKKVFPAALGIETLHAATLVHDDIIDKAKTRRGQPTVSAQYGVNMAVYAGDYLYAQSVLLLAESSLPMDRQETVGHAVRSMCAGEVEQYLQRYTVSGVPGYLKRIIRKTGVLFAAACAIGAKAGGLDDKTVKQLTRFGLHFGVAFQIRDDLLDMESTSVVEGKPVVNDLKDGIVTLPLILSARNPEVRSAIDACFAGSRDIKEVLELVRDTGGHRESRELMMKYLKKCQNVLDILPKTAPYNAMNALLNWF